MKQGIKNSYFIIQAKYQQLFNRFILKLILRQIHLRLKSCNILIIISGKQHVINLFLSDIFYKIQKYFNINKYKWKFLWVTNFPMFCWNTDKINWEVCHHPFTLTRHINEMNFIIKNPANFFSHSFDLILNGVEIGGGSTRINKSYLQQNIFNIIGVSKKQFIFLLNSLKSGAPNFGGLAIGIDRLIMLMLNSCSIKNIIAFPKSRSLKCLLLNAPYKVEINQTKILGLNI